MAKTTFALLDAELDQAQMELQAHADRMLRSTADAYKLVASAQRRLRLLHKQAAQART